MDKCAFHEDVTNLLISFCQLDPPSSIGGSNSNLKIYSHVETFILSQMCSPNPTIQLDAYHRFITLWHLMYTYPNDQHKSTIIHDDHTNMDDGIGEILKQTKTPLFSTTAATVTNSDIKQTGRKKDLNREILYKFKSMMITPWRRLFLNGDSGDKGSSEFDHLNFGQYTIPFYQYEHFVVGFLFKLPNVLFILY